MKSLRDLYQKQLTDVYKSQKATLRVLPLLQRAAAAPDLIIALRHELQMTGDHARRLEQLLDASAIEDEPMPTHFASIIHECLEVTRVRDANADVRDAALIAATQHLQHDQIVGLGCARTWARVMGDLQAADILQNMLREV